MYNIKIEPSTPIESLRKAGIVPDWMARDCHRYGWPGCWSSNSSILVRMTSSL